MREGYKMDYVFRTFEAKGVKPDNLAEQMETYFLRRGLIKCNPNNIYGAFHSTDAGVHLEGHEHANVLNVNVVASRNSHFIDDLVRAFPKLKGESIEIISSK
jgi:hypothetical protein